MNYTVVIEGQRIPVPEELGTDDAKLKQVLAPVYPDVANALITRVTAGEEVTVNVAKKAGTKGGNNEPRTLKGATREREGREGILREEKKKTALGLLRECKGGQNPIIELWQELDLAGKALGPVEILALDERIEKALEEGAQEANAMQKALARLDAARAIPAPGVVAGF